METPHSGGFIIKFQLIGLVSRVLCGVQVHRRGHLSRRHVAMPLVTAFAVVATREQTSGRRKCLTYGVAWDRVYSGSMSP